jgi:hypothetical protein
VLVDGRLNGLIPAPAPGFLPATWNVRGGLETDGTRVFFSSADFSDSYTLMSVPATGGDVTVLADVATGSGDFARDLELDADYLYWVDAISVRRLAKIGGAPVSLASTSSPSVGLTIEGQTLFWLETPCCAHGQKGTLRRVSTGGGTPLTLRTNIDAATAIASSPSHVVWAEGGTLGAVEGFGRIGTTTHDGNDATILVESAEGGPFDVDATHVYFANRFTIKRAPITGGNVERLVIGDFTVTDVATDGSHVYWTEQPQASVRRVATTGGPATTLGVGNGAAGIVRLDATHVYWSEGATLVRRVAKTGGTASIVLGPVAGGLTDFLVQDGTLYFSEWDGARLRRLPATGGDIQTITERLPDQTRRITTDGTTLWWIDQIDLGKVPVAGGTIELLASMRDASTPLLANELAVDATRLFWTEVVLDRIRVASPK